MTYTIELALLKEKAQTLEELLRRQEYLADEIHRNRNALKEDPEETWRIETIAENEKRIDAIDHIIKLITK